MTIQIPVFSPDWKSLGNVADGSNTIDAHQDQRLALVIRVFQLFDEAFLDGKIDEFHERQTSCDIEDVPPCHFVENFFAGRFLVVGDRRDGVD
jgi:hypothetical protein